MMRCFLLLFFYGLLYSQEARAVDLAFGYQGISVDKGISLQLSVPKIWGDSSGLFLEVSGNETAGIPVGETQVQHKNYLLWHAGWNWEKTVQENLYWTWVFGLGTTLPRSDLEDKITLTGTLRTGLEHQFHPRVRSYVMLGVEMNLWNRATGIIGEPYYARGTTSQFGFRFSL
tara:strand:+ start:635 stop:1153 length:519 start_codon:yes stop_codon:yes gene_type:complete